jgi:hypothetical protein
VTAWIQVREHGQDAPVVVRIRLQPELGEDGGDRRFDGLDRQRQTIGDRAVGPASAVSAGAVWLSVRADDERLPVPTEATLVRIDPASGEVVAEFVTGGTIQAGLIYAADDVVWIRAIKPFLTRIDPATNDIAETLEANRAGGSVTVAFGSLWATANEFNTVWRLTP